MAASEAGLTGVPEMGSMAVSETIGLSVVSEVPVGSVTASGVGGLIQHQIFSRTIVRVSSKQHFGAFGRPESYPAAPTRGTLFSSSSTVFSFAKIRPRCIFEPQGTHLRTVELVAENPQTSVSINISSAHGRKEAVTHLKCLQSIFDIIRKSLQIISVSVSEH